MTDLEKRYTERCYVIAHDGEAALKRRVSRFRQMLPDLGAVETTRRLVLATDPSDTFRDLWLLSRLGERNRALDLTVEALIVIEEGRWGGLFTPQIIHAARQRLLDHGWTSPAGVEIE